MNSPDLIRAHAERVIQNRRLIGAFILFFVFIPLPLVLLGYLQWASLAVAVWLLYLYLDPSLGAPSAADLQEVLRDDKTAAVRRPVFANRENVSEVALIDPLSQPTSDKRYADLVGQDENVLSSGGELHAPAHKFQHVKK